jgi:hypothetical protein
MAGRQFGWNAEPSFDRIDTMRLDNRNRETGGSEMLGPS